MTRPIYEDSIETREQLFKSDIPWGTKQTADWISSWEEDVIIILLLVKDNYMQYLYNIFRINIKNLPEEL